MGEHTDGRTDHARPETPHRDDAASMETGSASRPPDPQAAGVDEDEVRDAVEQVVGESASGGQGGERA